MLSTNINFVHSRGLLIVNDRFPLENIYGKVEFEESKPTWKVYN